MSQSTCPLCRGYKQIPESFLKTGGSPHLVECPRCKGDGKWYSPSGPPAPVETPKDQDAGKGKGKPDHFFLKSKLYEKCLGCRGTGKTSTPMMVDGMKIPAGKTLIVYGAPMPGPDVYSGALPVGSGCPLCENGYADTGDTVGGIERLKGQRDLLLVSVVTVDEMLSELAKLSSALAEGCAAICAKLKEAMAVCGESAIRNARHRRDQARREVEREERTSSTNQSGGSALPPG